MNKPTILITNDDGIQAKGIYNLVSFLKELANIVVVAPSKAQSGQSMAITIADPLRVHKTSFDGAKQAFSCSGTPTDCVKIAIHEILEEKPDLILSGINHGSNASVNVNYSGTMGAAIEGSMEGIASVGFSLLNHDPQAEFSMCEQIVKDVVQFLLKNKHSLPSHIAYNVNIPNIKASEIKGIKWCRQANGDWVEQLEKRFDGSNQAYYWLTGSFDTQDKIQGTDLFALEQGFASVVPIQYDLTNYKALKALENYDI